MDSKWGGCDRHIRTSLPGGPMPYHLQPILFVCFAILSLDEIQFNMTFFFLKKDIYFTFFFKEFLYFIIYLFIFGCVGSSFLCEDFLQLWQVGATLHRGARASDYRGLSCCGAQAPDAQAQQLWLTGLVAPQHNMTF